MENRDYLNTCLKIIICQLGFIAGLLIGLVKK